MKPLTSEERREKAALEGRVGEFQDFACAVSDALWGGELGWDHVGLKATANEVRKRLRERDTLRSDCIALATAGDKRIQKWMDKLHADGCPLRYDYPDDYPADGCPCLAPALERAEERIKELEDMLEDARDGHIEQQKIAEQWAEDCEKSKDLHRQAVEERDRIYEENRRLREEVRGLEHTIRRCRDNIDILRRLVAKA